MPKGLLKKLMSGATGIQIKARNERAKKRKAELDRLIEGFFTADRAREFMTLDEMMAEFRGLGSLFPANTAMPDFYLPEWRRKEAHGGTQTWYVLVNEAGVSVFVVWPMVGKNNVQGYKAWSLRDNDFELAKLNYL